MRTGLPQQPCEHVLKKCLVQFDALLLLQETAAQAARSRQECGQSTKGERFLAGGGSEGGAVSEPLKATF